MMNLLSYIIGNDHFCKMSKRKKLHCRPEPALGQPRITGRLCLCVVCCVLYVLTGIELWIYQSNFYITLATGYCHGLVVHPHV